MGPGTRDYDKPLMGAKARTEWELLVWLSSGTSYSRWGFAASWGCPGLTKPTARRRKAEQNTALAMALQRCTIPQIRRRIKWFLTGVGGRLLHLPRYVSHGASAAPETHCSAV